MDRAILMSLENYLSFSAAQFDIVSHILTFGVGAQLVGLVYFLTTRQNLHPNFRVTSTVSAVVMVSAAAILLNQQLLWRQTFVWTGQVWLPGKSVFTNGFRYINWSIDVPMLSTALLLALGLRGREFRVEWSKATWSALAMIWLGYVGQFYESTDLEQLYLWGALSTVAMVYLVYVLAMNLFRRLPSFANPRVRNLLRGLFWLMLGSWTLYPIAYLLPHFAPDAWGMVLRQVLFTVADVLSKVVFGVLISQICLLRSRELGFEPALQSPVV